MKKNKEEKQEKSYQMTFLWQAMGLNQAGLHAEGRDGGGETTNKKYKK